MQELVIATTNEGKLIEFKELMKDMDVELKSLKEWADVPAPEEIGKNFCCQCQTEGSLLRENDR